ncbi:MAG: pyrroloquinoline quinone-dependent dehydrogenase [Acidobacteriales bacterium]|nr:pyrroloquinoline quinone-dependent dehydrogenase [Terriglobales bacterium]
MRMWRFLIWVCLSTIGISAAEGQWNSYGADEAGTRFSSLKSINRANVAHLKSAWMYRTGALDAASDLNRKAAFEATPILFENRLYVSTPFDTVVALEPASGRELWKFDPHVPRNTDYSEVTSRGVAAWTDSDSAEGTPCHARIFLGTLDARLFALDAKTGVPCEQFGDTGQVDLKAGIRLRDPGQYQITSPPVVVNGVVISGSSVGDNRAVESESGVVRGYDARTGRLIWKWDPIPWAQKQSLHTGAANAWAAFAADSGENLVFIPTGSASPDFYGGLRPGENRWANSVVALRATTGKFIWGFQVVHHDLWDYDVASQPTIIPYSGRKAVLVNTKMGSVFLLDEKTGQALTPIEERAVPKSVVPGEQAWPTQPRSVFFPALNPQQFGEPALSGHESDQAECRKQLATLRNDGLFTPPSLEGSVAYPGNVGGVNWGGAAVDPSSLLMVANVNNLAFILRLLPQEKLRTEQEHLGDRLHGEWGKQTGSPYAIYRRPFFSSAGIPCTTPPWGTTTALDLRTGKIIWQKPAGTMIPGKNTGTITLGGPILTAGGLVFTAATMDTYFRALDVNTGEELWKVELPASAQSTPMTYSLAGRQYVVISAGGHGKLGTKQGDYVVAFALP